MHRFAGDLHGHECAARVSENRADRDGKKVCMYIHETARGADRLLNLQFGTEEKEDEERERGRELGVGV